MPRGVLPISRQELAHALKLDADAIHAIHIDAEHDRLLLIMSHAKARDAAEHERLTELTLRPEKIAVLMPTGKKRHWYHKLGDAIFEPKPTDVQRQPPASARH